MLTEGMRSTQVPSVCAIILGAGLLLGGSSAATAMTGDGATRRSSADVSDAAAVARRLAAYEASLGGGAAGSRKVAAAIPAFARKYGLRCSACHTAWPELNAFGQRFRDNGYQLGNNRDSPIWQNPSYFPVSFRITPQWHMETTTSQLVDAVPGDATSGLVPRTLTQHGFDLSGMDLWTAGTLYKDISFVLLVSSDAFASFHFESAFVRFDNLESTWLNVKLGRFETDNLISEKRFLFLSANGGLYQSYHFDPVGSSDNFGIGDNQLGLEVSGHSANSYTRYAVALVSSSEGTPGLSGASTYDTYLTFSQAFDAGRLGVERLGVYAYVGERPTIQPTLNGVAIGGVATGNKPFYRAGAAGDFYLENLEFLPFFIHGYDNAYLGTSTAANAALPTGAQAPTWNGGFLETHYYVNPRLVFTQRVEAIRMDQQALPTTPSSLGNIDAYSFGTRFMPFMYSRAGLAFHLEYSLTKTVGAVPISLDGVDLPPLTPTTAVYSSSLLFAIDFAF